MEMAPWSFQLVRYNLCWSHSLERMPATESVVLDEHGVECKCRGTQRWWTYSFPSLRRNRQDARPATNDTGLCWQESSPEPQLVTWIIPKGYMSSHLFCHSHWDILERRPNRPSSGYADSDRQLSRDGFGEHSLWDEMSSPVVCCPVAVKLKPEQLRVAKRLSHCCRKNLHDWCPQASRAESVSIQDCVIFFQLFLHSSLHGVLLSALT